MGNTTAPIGRSRRILLVEDHRDTADVLARLLNYDGHRVWVAYDCASAEECARRERFDLFLIDVGLPDGDGCDLLACLQKHCLAPGVAMTGFAMEPDVERGREAGFVEYLVKPMVMDRIRECLARLDARADLATLSGSVTGAATATEIAASPIRPLPAPHAKGGGADASSSTVVS